MPRPVACRDRSADGSAAIIAMLVLAVTCLVPPREAAAQFEGRVYAVTGARLVTLSGGVIESGTIILRNGLIEALGPDVTPPADAVVIDGEGLTVYPGFIDAYSQAGLESPQGQEREHAGNIANRLASDRFDPGSNDLDTYRKQGFTTALLVRNDGVFAGKAVLMNLLGEGVPGMTVKAPIVQVMGYTGQPGYPGTLMAVVAYQRQTLLDALYHNLLKNRYMRDPQGMARPPSDPDLEALIPVAAGESPVLGIVNRENDLKRLRNLAEEFELNFWIAGAEEAFRVPDIIREAGAPVLVSLNYTPIGQVTGHWFDRAFRNLSDDDKKALDERDEAAMHGNAATVFRTGVPFALATGGMRNAGDFLKNLRSAVEAGLPAGEALNALTINPAHIFGVDRVLGTLEVGKIANLTLVSGDIFTEEDSYIAHVFIDGRKQTFEKPKPKATGTGGVAGEWDVTMSFGGETQEMTMSLSQSGEEVEGEISAEGEVFSVKGTFKEGKMELTGSIPELGTLTITGTLEGDTITGSLGLGPMGTAPFTAKRKPGVNNAASRRAGR